MIEIVCHRGLWKKKNEHNSFEACLNGLSHFDGIEIDLRSLDGTIVLSHDSLLLDKSDKLTSLELLFKNNINGFYALNIKEDGLSKKLLSLIKKYKIKSYMCFDLSTPEKIVYKKTGLIVFERYGDCDQWSNDYQTSPGLVIDIFNFNNIQKCLNNAKIKNYKYPLFIISPELHGQKHLPMWNFIKKISSKSISIKICTDFPVEASKFFNRNTN